MRVAVFTLDGEFVRKIQPDEEKIDWCAGVTVTMDGHIAVAVEAVLWLCQGVSRCW